MSEQGDKEKNISSDEVNDTSAQSDHNSNYTESSPLDDTKSGTSVSTKRPRKKRKVFTCERCRKVKTRCDFEPLSGKCHRCAVLNLDCSLSASMGADPMGIQKSGSERVLKLPMSDLKQPPSKALPISSLTSPIDYVPRPSISKPKSLPSIESISAETRLEKVEKEIAAMNSKMDKIISLLETKDNTLDAARTLSTLNTPEELRSMNIANSDMFNRKSSFQPKGIISKPFGGSTRLKLKEYPYKILNDIDERLFPLTATSQQEAIEREQRPSAVARVNFLHFYERNKALVHKLVKDFLVTSHFYIVPSTMKEIDENFAKNHLFITSVYSIIAMSSADNDEYGKKQEELYPLVERLLTNTLTMFDKLKAQDLEAILYCSMFHIARKAKRHRQLKFNSLILSNFALFSLLNNFDFDGIKNRVNNLQYNTTDLYHVRLLNALTACNLEYSLIYGTISPKDDTVQELNILVTKFPQSNSADILKLSEIDMGNIVIAIYGNFQTYFQRFFDVNITLNKQSGFDLKILEISELCQWLRDWNEVLEKHNGGILKFHYHFYHIMICRSFLNEFLNEMNDCPSFLNGVIHTMKYHATSLLVEFLKLPPKLIKGAPILTTNELIYTCMTLCDYLYWFDVLERQEILNMCTKVYWHLNTIGETLNEMTENMGKIIKSIIDTTRSQASNLNPPPLSILKLHSKDESTRTPVTASTPLAPITSRIKKPIDHSIAAPAAVVQRVSSSVTSTSSHELSQPPTAINGLLPDVTNFNSFEDFFQDFFDHLKPTTKKMFS